VAARLAATAFAVAVTIALFMTLGPKRTRLVAQVMAAVIGAACVIGLQLAAIQSLGSLSRTDVLGSSALVAFAPDSGSILYWPARAAVGDPTALAGVLGSSTLLLGAAIALFAPRFGDCVIAASGVSPTTTRRLSNSNGFRRATPRRALRLKEWLLLRRDPWLVSQTLMQILYLVPPAFLLWRAFGEGAGAVVVLVPVLVMAAGQLAGGLAWLAISGEDAPELVATAPISATQILRAKIEAVIGIIGLVFLPFVAAIALISLWHAVVPRWQLRHRRLRQFRSSIFSARRPGEATSADGRRPRARLRLRRRFPRSPGPAPRHSPQQARGSQRCPACLR
jgi:ABC-2 type transport system permease protein